MCGPTAAYPQYEMHNFADWRPNGSFHEFVAATTGQIDCLSVHFYDTFTPEPDGVSRPSHLRHLPLGAWRTPSLLADSDR